MSTSENEQVAGVAGRSDGATPALAVACLARRAAFRGAWLMVATAAAGLPSCGGSDHSDSDRTAIRKTVNAYIAALKAKDPSAACRTFYFDYPPPKKDRPLRRGDIQRCAEDVEDIEETKRKTEGSVGKIIVNGDQATVSVNRPHAPPWLPLKLRRFGDDWRIPYRPPIR
jgi:hypothetical protein